MAIIIVEQIILRTISLRLITLTTIVWVLKLRRISIIIYKPYLAWILTPIADDIIITHYQRIINKRIIIIATVL